MHIISDISNDACLYDEGMFYVIKNYLLFKTFDGKLDKADVIVQKIFDIKTLMEVKKICNLHVDKVIYFKAQLLNIFNQLEEFDKNGNKILYGLVSHDGILRYLCKLQELGFIENLYVDNDSARICSLKSEEFLFGNMRFKDFINSDVKRNAYVYNISFNLTDKRMLISDLYKFINKKRLDIHYFVDDYDNKLFIDVLENKNKVKVRF